ncbi:MAG TPA: homoserine kinase [Candidatus Obscuribacterales bacterium]
MTASGTGARENGAPAGARRLALRIPGSTSNLGPGFDTLGLALGIYTRLTFDLLLSNDPQVPLITLKGAIARGLPADRNNLIYAVLSKLWHDKPELLHRVRITIESDIPLGRGLGSSATAILGTVWAARVLAGEDPDRAGVLADATPLEGHPDNLAASLHGGLIICAEAASSRHIITQRLKWPDEWHTILVVPAYSLTTRVARAVLPKQVPLPDAVANVQRVALLVAAVVNRDETALFEALNDRLHEPYRLEMVPELSLLRRHLSGMPILGCVLSGAGSSVLIVVNKRHKGQVVDSLTAWSASQRSAPRILDLIVDHEGLKELPV